MQENIGLTLRKIAETQEGKLLEIREELLTILENTCYQNGEVDMMMRNREFCDETIIYMNKLYNLIIKTVGEKHSLSLPSLLTVLNEASEKPFTWVIGKEKGVLRDTVIEENMITVKPYSEAKLLEKIGLIEIMKLETGNNKNR